MTGIYVGEICTGKKIEPGYMKGTAEALRASVREHSCCNPPICPAASEVIYVKMGAIAAALLQNAHVRALPMTLRFPISISSITPNGFMARAFSTSLNVTMTRPHFSTSQMMGAK
ncbi:hypothetical protein FOVSG1_005961 [Fusarium oxysporum f. sp. vasinfectum]